jgi:hypothetical protein
MSWGSCFLLPHMVNPNPDIETTFETGLWQQRCIRRGFAFRCPRSEG